MVERRNERGTRTAYTSTDLEHAKCPSLRAGDLAYRRSREPIEIAAHEVVAVGDFVDLDAPLREQELHRVQFAPHQFGEPPRRRPEVVQQLAAAIDARLKLIDA